MVLGRPKDGILKEYEGWRNEKRRSDKRKRGSEEARKEREERKKLVNGCWHYILGQVGAKESKDD